jgi:hypothetical protein
LPPPAPGRKASKHTLPCCEPDEQLSVINSGQVLDKLEEIYFDFYYLINYTFLEIEITLA